MSAAALVKEATSMDSSSAPGKATSLVGDLTLPVVAISIIFVLLIPLPAALIDAMLIVSIGASVLVFLSAVQIKKPVEFSVFPTLLLLLTLFRLSLNIASSRRILLHGSEDTGAAGDVIKAFGQFVVGGNYVVGFVIFLTLIAIQSLVISHGSVRTAEVTARFTLDALPGKQMAIDADLNAGIIREATARQRREAIAREAEFYGAMDGAARFSQRDSMATILMTGVNIVAGLLVGTLQHGIPILESVRTYTILTVGDGLVTVIPSLLVSIAGGLVLTRASSATSLHDELGSQLLGAKKTLFIAAGVLASMSLIPGLPKLSFVAMAVSLALLTKKIAARDDSRPGIQVGPDGVAKAAIAAKPSVLRDLSLNVGFQLIPLISEAKNGDLLLRIKSMRKNLGEELGFIIPPIHISDNLKLKPNEYRVFIRATEIASWQLEINELLAVSQRKNLRALPGKVTIEPAFRSNAIWINRQSETAAVAAGYAIVEPYQVVLTHLAELIRGNAADLLTRGEVKRLLDSTLESHPRLVDELTPKLMTLGEVQRVLQQLLRERVSIRDLGTILEALIDQASLDKQLINCIERVRHQLSSEIVQALLRPDGKLHAYLIDHKLENSIQALLSNEAERNALAGPSLQISPVKHLIEAVKRLTSDTTDLAPLVLVCQSPARFHIHNWLTASIPRIATVAPSELPIGIEIETLGTII